MRLYQPLWNTIKSNLSHSIEVPLEDHAKVIQAVKKERAIDYGWKFWALDSGLTFSLKADIEGTTIHFKLTTNL